MSKSHSQLPRFIVDIAAGLGGCTSFLPAENTSAPLQLQTISLLYRAIGHRQGRFAEGFRAACVDCVLAASGRPAS